MGDARDLGVLAVRLGVGGLCFAHGAQKLFGWFGGGGVKGTGQFFDSMGFTPGERSATMAGLAEAGGGLLLAAGLATGPAGAALLGNMAVASSVHAPAIFATSGGYELPATYGLLGSAFALTGPGRYSLDHATGYALNKPWMRIAAVAGAVATATYLIRKRNRVLAERDEASESDAGA
jgi:putative oxidoreductase